MKAKDLDRLRYRIEFAVFCVLMVLLATLYTLIIKNYLPN